MKTRVRAVILQEHSVLLIHRIKGGQEYWVFPGGGVEQGETQETALQREALEELGVVVSVDRQFAMHERDKEKQDPQQEVFYFCSITGGELGTGKGPEFQKGTHYEGMYALEWVSLASISQRNVVPDAIKAKLLEEVNP